jgi:HK97 gp10 family phage protein
MTRTTITGIEDLRAALADLTRQLRGRVLRTALAAGARLVRDEARRLAPVLAAPVRSKGRLIRKPGTLRKAISVRTSKLARRRGDVGVFVNVRPAKGAKLRGGAVVRASQRGADNPDDPYYWRWVEFGRQGRAAAPARRRVPAVQRGRQALRAVGTLAPVRFLQRSAARLPDALREFQRQVGPAITKLNQRKP